MSLSFHIHKFKIIFVPIQIFLQDTLVVCCQNICLDRSSNRLQCLVCLTFRIVVLHIVQRSEGSLDRDVETLVARVIEGFADGRSDDIRLAILGRGLRKHLVLLQ